MVKRNVITVSLLSIISAAFLAPASVGYSAYKVKACQAEIQRYCPESSDVSKCLDEHISKLSPACKKAHAEKKKETDRLTARVWKDCLGDIQARCEGVPQSGIVDCLREHEADLQPKCRATIASSPLP